MMKFVKQRCALPIINLDKISNCGQISQIPRHSKLLPNTLRCLIVGPSNSGKTNVMISLLIDPNGLKFQNIYIYSKSLYQPKYIFLKSIIQNTPEVSLHLFDDCKEILEPNAVKENSIFIFDDIVCDKQEKMKEYFCRGRHKGVDVFYLSQTYSRIPKQLVRDNANILLLFNQDEMNLKHVYNDHVGHDMTFKDFQTICYECWKDEYGFLVINKDNTLNNGRYRKGFDLYIKV